MTGQRDLACSVFLAVLLAAGAAFAQERDPTASFDVRDVLGRMPHDISELPTREEAEGRAVTFNGSLAGTLTTNAGATPFDPVDTGYLTPGIGLGVTPVSVGGWDIGGGAMLDADHYSGDYDDDFGQGRIEGFAFAERGAGAGTLTVEVIVLGIFSSDFSDHDLDLYIGDLTYSVSRGGFSADIGVDYEHSDAPELRRARVSATFAYALPETQFGYEITFEGDLAFSDFVDGANSGRNDTVVAAAVTAERELAGWTLEWEAGLVNRFSNRESARFTALDLVFEVGRQF
jgi:hypothetical protein